MSKERRTGYDAAAARSDQSDTRVVVELKSDATLVKETSSLSQRAAQMIVDSVEACKAAKAFLQGVIALRRKIESHYDEIKKPLNETRAKVLEMEKRDLAPVKDIEHAMSSRIFDFESAEERKRREAARIEEDRRQRDEQERRQREARALEEQARATSRRVDKAALREQATAIKEAPPPAITVEAKPVKEDTAIDGMHSRTTWSGTVVNLEQFVKLVASGRAPLVVPGGTSIEINQAWLNKMATSLGAELETTYPGLKAIPKTGYVSK